MSYLTGYLLADRILAKSSCRREFRTGEFVFREGDPADALFIVASGKIGIFKSGEAGESQLAEVGPEGIFGEMGLLGGQDKRAADARAIQDSVLVMVRENPVELLSAMGESHAAIDLLKRLVCALGQWLRARNERAARSSGEAMMVTTGDARDLEAVRRHLPRGFLRFFPRQERLAEGEFLLKEGEKSRGFHFIHHGVLEVITGDPEAGGKVVAELHGPAVAGELGYFSGEPRAASLRAKGEVAHTYFAGHQFEEIEESDPERALEMLFAVAKSLVAMLREPGR
jgi:CRP-like cAMP-binding protein